MKKEEIHLGDLKRWLIGQTTPEFMVEVAIRTVVMYLILVLTVRLMGKRMTSQMTITEFSVMVTLGAIVSPAMQLPDRGLLFGVGGLVVAIFFQRGINLWAFNNEKIEHLTQGKMVTLVKDGTLVLEELDKLHITRQQVFALLREKDIENLGQVKRAYLEAGGTLSVFEEVTNKPGLPVFPANDAILKVEQNEASDRDMACCSCGHVQQIKNPGTMCELCDAHQWINAYSLK